MRAYVITIDRLSTKFKRLLEQLESTGLEIEVVDGVIPPQEFASLYDAKAFLKRYGRHPTRGEVGCAMSHQEVYERMASFDELSAFVFEDDAVLSERFLSQLSTIHEQWVGLGAVSFYSEGAFVSKHLNNSGLMPTIFMCDNTLGYWISLRSALMLRSAKVSGGRLIGLADWPLAPQTFGLHLLSGSQMLHDSVASSLEVARQQRRIDSRWQIGKIRRSLNFWLYRTVGKCCWNYHSARTGTWQ